MSSKPKVIICERSGQWAAGLRITLSREIALRETRSLAACLEELCGTPSSFVVLELTDGNLERLLEFLERIGNEFQRSRVAIVADRRLAECEWLVREAGAIHFATSPRRTTDLTRLAERHALLVPGPKRSLATQVWDSLPWPEAATG